ncbi:hypothetical protein CBE89_10085 [Corynebacterium striatum]|uniref:Uncharacterized protein n=1 Tax=Corynebacterium striatum TaxID=43770 RepID=A0A2Z2J119_CORST|nr:hypothetical protein CBE89_10085 [Corynebacterium striatum]
MSGKEVNRSAFSGALYRGRASVDAAMIHLVFTWSFLQVTDRLSGSLFLLLENHDMFTSIPLGFGGKLWQSSLYLKRVRRKKGR